VAAEDADAHRIAGIGAVDVEVGVTDGDLTALGADVGEGVVDVSEQVSGDVGDLIRVAPPRRSSQGSRRSPGGQRQPGALPETTRSWSRTPHKMKGERRR
jgi:hypothetical protein